LCCLFFFNIRILVISLVSSSSSLINKDYAMYVNLRCLLSRYILGAFLVNRCIELLLQMNSHRFRQVFWLPLWYLVVIVLSVRLLLYVFWLPLLYLVGHCIVCPSYIVNVYRMSLHCIYRIVTELNKITCTYP
jgi:uncharacterized membrane protein